MILSKKPNLFHILLIASALVFTACGDDDDDVTNNGADNNSTNNAVHNNHSNNGATNNGTTNNGATNNAHMAFMFEATLDPETAAVGKHVMTITVMDMEHQPVVGATLVVTPWMPHHGHGSPSTPVITDNGDGTYTATDVEFTMPGMWEVTVAATLDSVEAEHVFMYEI